MAGEGGTHEAGTARLRELIARQPMASVLVALAIGLVLAGGIGTALVLSKSADISDLESELDSTSASLAEVESERDQAEEFANRIRARKNSIIGKAKTRADGIVSDAKSELARVQSKLSSARSGLDVTEGRLEQLQNSLDDAKRTKQLSSFGDGIWQADADYIPGTWRAPGGPGCYWAKLNSGNTSDIADNNFTTGGGQQVITLDSAFFETSDCGTWERIGD